ncbi:MAG: hypothetical protein AAF610_12545 [Pseudomonadota bacterium]
MKEQPLDDATEIDAAHAVASISTWLASVGQEAYAVGRLAKAEAELSIATSLAAVRSKVLSMFALALSLLFAGCAISALIAEWIGSWGVGLAATSALCLAASVAWATCARRSASRIGMDRTAQAVRSWS